MSVANEITYKILLNLPTEKRYQCYCHFRWTKYYIDCLPVIYNLETVIKKNIISLFEWWFYYKYYTILDLNDVIFFSSKYSSIEILDWMAIKYSKYYWDMKIKESIVVAIENGNLDVIIWFHTKFNCTELNVYRLTNIIIKNNQLEILIWMYEKYKKLFYDYETIDIPARNNNIDIIKWIFDNFETEKLSYIYAIYHAISHENIEMLSLFIKKFTLKKILFKTDSRYCLKNAMMNGNVIFLQWFYDNIGPECIHINMEGIEHAIRNEHIPVLNWILLNMPRFKFYSYFISLAASYNKIIVLQWFLDTFEKNELVTSFTDVSIPHLHPETIDFVKNNFKLKKKLTVLIPKKMKLYKRIQYNMCKLLFGVDYNYFF